MSETFTQSPEQSTSKEIPEVPKSRELYNGDINDAVISVQKKSGVNISPEWWASEVGNDGSSEDILDRFDKAYEHMIWRIHKVPEEQIITLQSHVDTDPHPEQRAQQINGINIPYALIGDEVDPAAWAATEQQRRLDYVFHEAEYYLNREFQIGDETYTVDSISYTGTDGNYETLEIKIKNTETGQVSEYLEPNEVNQMIATGEKSRNVIETDDTRTTTPSETNHPSKDPELARRIDKELEDFDQNAAFERAQFESFLYAHPELIENTPEPSEESAPHSPYAPIPQSNPTIDAIENVGQPTLKSIKQKRTDAINDFDKFIANHPELEELRDEYMNDLENYLKALSGR